MSNDPIASTGRGGAGNIGPDDKIYTDGEIVREGPVGDQGDGAYSAGVRSSNRDLQIKPSSPHKHVEKSLAPSRRCCARPTLNE